MATLEVSLCAPCIAVLEHAMWICPTANGVHIDFLVNAILSNFPYHFCNKLLRLKKIKF